MWLYWYLPEAASATDTDEYLSLCYLAVGIICICLHHLGNISVKSTDVLTDVADRSLNF